jgi:hypothetical protein
MKSGTGFAALCIVFLVVGGVASGASEYHRESLRGLTGVCIRLERVSEIARMDGMNVRGIQTDVEQKLKQAGITVLTQPQALQEPGSPTLYVFVNAKQTFYPEGATSDPAGAPYVVMVTVSLLQNVVSVRDPKLSLREVKTWDAGYLRSLEPVQVKEARATVGDLVDEFINDWRTVNQKK